MSWLVAHAALLHLAAVVGSGRASGPSASHLIIAGVNKAGTTSLFSALSALPAIAPASVKETGFFLPARYGTPLPSRGAYDAFFSDAAPGQLRLEATPSYFYGGAAVAGAIADSLAAPKVIVVLREPVQRAVSFFRYQKVRLRFPAELSIEEYLATADALTAADFLDPANERYMAVRGGRYADFLPGWTGVLGADRLHIIGFEDMVADPARVLAGVEGWLGLDPDPAAARAFASENRTTAFRNAALQRLALFGNDRLEQFLRRHGGFKRRMRALYYRVNGRQADDPVSDTVLAELAERFVDPNARLARQLDAAGQRRPSWLVAASGLVTTPPGDPDPAP